MGTVREITKAHFDATLAFANEVRAKMGREPVDKLEPGAPCAAGFCVLARTIAPENRPGERSILGVVPMFVGPKVEVNFYEAGNTVEQVVCHEKLVHEFVLAFDAGHLPELVDRGMQLAEEMGG